MRASRNLLAGSCLLVVRQPIERQRQDRLVVPLDGRRMYGDSCANKINRIFQCSWSPIEWSGQVAYLLRMGSLE